MKKTLLAIAASSVLAATAAPALAKDKIIGVSWKVFQEERWKRDEAVIKEIVEANGDKYISADAQGSAAKKYSSRISTAARLKTSVKRSPMAGNLKMPRRTWSNA